MKMLTYWSLLGFENESMPENKKTARTFVRAVFVLVLLDWIAGKSYAEFLEYLSIDFAEHYG